MHLGGVSDLSSRWGVAKPRPPQIYRVDLAKGCNRRGHLIWGGASDLGWGGSDLGWSGSYLGYGRVHL